jgi:hypothetical protein
MNLVDQLQPAVFVVDKDRNVRNLIVEALENEGRTPATVSPSDQAATDPIDEPLGGHSNKIRPRPTPSTIWKRR